MAPLIERLLSIRALKILGGVSVRMGSIADIKSGNGLGTTDAALKSGVLETNLFDPDWYSKKYLRTSTTEIDPLEHYLEIGASNDFDPGPNFDASWYRSTYSGVMRSGEIPILHYWASWRKMGLQRKQSEGVAHFSPVIMNVPVAPVQRCSSDLFRRFAIGSASRPKISVVITCFNYGRFIGDAVRSVVCSDMGNFEIIVVEGGSTDGDTVSQVSNLDYRNLRLLFRESPKNVSDNRNFGIAHAAGEYICCLDADDMIDPTYLRKAFSLLEEDVCDVVTSGYMDFGASSQRHKLKIDPELNDLLEGNHVIVSAIFRKSFWERAEGFWHVEPSIFGHVIEDWNFWMRIAALGARFKTVENEYFLLHRVHGESRSSLTAQIDYETQCNVQREINRNYMTKCIQELGGGRRGLT